MIPLRDENPTTIRPIVTIGLIVACSCVFLWQLTHNPDAQRLIVYRLGTIPVTLFGHAQLSPEIALIPAPVTVVTSMFLHGGWVHLLGNMLYLWIFGNNIEEAMGHGRFGIFYLVCGIVAVFAHALPNPGSEIPMVGASGAISGVLGAYLLLYPHARVVVLVPLGFIAHTLRIKAMWVLGFWFGMQLVSSLFSDPNQGGVAFGAHIGGFAAGMALIPIFKYRHIRITNPLNPSPRHRR